MPGKSRCPNLCLGSCATCQALSLHLQGPNSVSTVGGLGVRVRVRHISLKETGCGKPILKDAGLCTLAQEAEASHKERRPRVGGPWGRQGVRQGLEKKRMIVCWRHFRFGKMKDSAGGWR